MCLTDNSAPNLCTKFEILAALFYDLVLSNNFTSFFLLFYPQCFLEPPQRQECRVRARTVSSLLSTPCIFTSFFVHLIFLGSIYRRGARRWRKLYKVNGHIFQAKRFNRVSKDFPNILCNIMQMHFSRAFNFGPDFSEDRMAKYIYSPPLKC